MTEPKRPLKIIVFSTKGRGTGAVLRAFYIAEALRQRGHRVTFAKPLPSLPLWFDMVLSAFYYPFYIFIVRAQVAFALKPYPTIVPALVLQRLFGAKIVFDVDDLDYDYSHGWFRSFHRWIQKPWPAWADLVTYHNPELLGPLRGFFKVPASKLVRLPQGVDRGLFNPGKTAARDLPPVAAALQNKKNAGPLLAFTAHLNVACDLEPVLEAFRLMRRSLPQARLLVAGGGPDEGRFKSLARDLDLSGAVHFTGMVEPRQVAACLGLCDAALVYYRDIPVNRHRASMKLREALACGCRVVATAVGEAVLFKKALFLSKPDPESFAKAVLTALKSRKSPQAAALLVKNWDWKRCVEPLEKELLSR